MSDIQILTFLSLQMVESIIPQNKESKTLIISS